MYNNEPVYTRRLVLFASGPAADTPGVRRVNRISFASWDSVVYADDPNMIRTPIVAEAKSASDAVAVQVHAPTFGFNDYHVTLDSTSPQHWKFKANVGRVAPVTTCLNDGHHRANPRGGVSFGLNVLRCHELMEFLIYSGRWQINSIDVRFVMGMAERQGKRITVKTGGFKIDSYDCVGLWRAAHAYEGIMSRYAKAAA